MQFRAEELPLQSIELSPPAITMPGSGVMTHTASHGVSLYVVSTPTVTSPAVQTVSFATDQSSGS
jgi:hypothetical protein